MSDTKTLQDPYLDILRKEGIPVSIYLVNGIKLTGIIECFDSIVVMLKESVSLMIYKSAISSIVPSRELPDWLGLSHKVNDVYQDNPMTESIPEQLQKAL